ncbi:MAG: hypothetical protein ACI84R_001283 [Candidatus Azotimanducaceae bacterium]|jgi:hypothetical protein
MNVMLTFRHHLVPQIIWAGLFFLIGRFLFKSTAIGLVVLALFAGHFILGFFSGHPHHLFGEDTH